MTGFIDPLETAGEEPVPGAAPTTPAEASASDDPEVIARVRDLVLQAHREVVPELVGGSSLDELLASIEPARQAYANLADRFTAAPSPEVAAPHPVPAGGTGPVPLDLDRMPAAEKLRRGILQRTRNRSSLSRP